MAISFQARETIEAALRAAAARVDGLGVDFDPSVRPSDPRFGDFQANGVLPRAKQLKVPPRPLAQALLDAVLADNSLDPAHFTLELAGPGFLNIRLQPAFLDAWLGTFRDEESFREGAQTTLAGRRIVVDFSSPNTAKEMHVGHIRSTVIGEAIARLLEFCGAQTVRDNHIGDWGTQFGMLIWAVKEQAYDLHGEHENPIADLEALYKHGHAHYKSDPAAAEAMRAELVKLQSGDPENTKIWKDIWNISWQAFEVIYKRLGIRFDEVLGESFYRDKVAAVCAELEACGLAVESEGALVVFHPEHPRFATQPFIVRKADGASNYATTDLATILYRLEHFRADEILYVVDSRQSDHFEQLFLTTQAWFAATNRQVPTLRHVSFGTILGEDRRPIKTKEGGSAKLRALVNEAVERARRVVDEKSPDLPPEERATIAEAVGLGAVRYADLSQNRTSDYIFCWEKMLALEGNTAPYLLYAVARLHSIFRKATTSPDGAFAAAAPIESEAECALARKLAAFPGALEQMLADYRPHVLCSYLFELAGVFSSFYNAEKVIVDEVPVRERRLRLCARTLRTLETGLHLLGLRTLERM
jgi:arginyl-tRNA synthetase